MKLDRAAVDRLLNLDDGTLKKTISALISAAGLDSNAASEVTGDLNAIRNVLSRVSDSDISNMTKVLGEERTAAMLEKLGKDANERQ